MTDSLDDLIEFLLEEIALGGEAGLSFIDVAAFVHSFYSRNSHGREQGRTADIDNCSNSQSTSSRIKIDRAFLIKIWTWLARLPDVSIGKERQFNNSRYADLESSYPGCFPTRYDNTHPGSESTLATDVSQRGVFDSSSTQNAASKRQLPYLYVNEERMWIAICGHAPDSARVFPSEWVLLSHIAASRHNGILQGDLVRVSGQDKRSVPKRTDALQDKGYIVKRTVYMKGNKTSRLYLQRFVDAPQGSDGDDPLAQEQTTVRNVARQLFDILKNNPLLPQQDILDALGMNTPGMASVFWLLIRHFRSTNCLKRIKTAFGFSAKSKDLRICIQFLREPGNEDWQTNETQGFDFDQSIHALAGSCETKSDSNDTFLQEPDSMIEPDDTDQQTRSCTLPSTAQRFPPQWNPDRSLANVVFEVIDDADFEGLTNTEVRNIITGPFVKRTLESLLVKLSNHTLQPQPASIRHLSILRSHGIHNGVLQYIHYTFEVYKERVRTGKSSWKDLSGGGRFSKASGAAERSGATITDTVATDNFGFPIRQKPEQQFQNGEAMMPKLLQNAKVKAIPKRTGEPFLQERDPGCVEIASYRTTPRVSKTVHHIPNGNAASQCLQHTSTTSLYENYEPRKTTISTSSTQFDHVLDNSDGTGQRIRGRPRKFTRGTERYWRDVFASINQEDASGHQSEQDRKKSANSPRAEQIFRNRPAMFDYTILQALELGLPVSSNVQNVSQDWIDRMQSVITRSRQGLYITPKGYHPGSRFKVAQILIFRFSRLRSEMNWLDEQQTLPRQLFPSSASHSFHNQAYYHRPERTPQSAVSLTNPKKVGSNNRKRVRINLDSTPSAVLPNDTQGSGPGTHIQQIPLQAEDSQHTSPGPSRNLADAFNNETGNSNLDNTIGLLPISTATTDFDLTDISLDAGSSIGPAEIVSSLYSHAQNPPPDSSGEKKSSQNTADIQESDNTASTKVLQHATKYADPSDTVLLTSEGTVKTSNSQMDMIRSSPIPSSDVSASQRKNNLGLDDDSISRPMPEHDNIRQSYTESAQDINRPHPSNATLHRSIDNESVPQLQMPLYRCIDGSPGAIHNQEMTINTETDQSSVGRIGQDTEISLSISGTHDTNNKSDSAVLQPSVNIDERTPSTTMFETRTRVSTPDAQETAQDSSEDSQPVIERTYRRENNSTPKRSKRDGLDVMSRAQVSKLCRILVLELLGLCSGLAPNVPWTFRRAMVPRWNEASVTADQLSTKTIRAAIKALCETGKTKQITFAFRAKSGVMVKMSVVALQGIDATNPAVIELQQHMRDAEPADYFPPEMELESRRPPNEWNRKRYKEEIRSKTRLRKQNKLLSIPSALTIASSKIGEPGSRTDTDLLSGHLTNRYEGMATGLVTEPSLQYLHENVDTTLSALEHNPEATKPCNLAFLTLYVPRLRELNLNTHRPTKHKVLSAAPNSKHKPDLPYIQEMVRTPTSTCLSSSRPERMSRSNHSLNNITWANSAPLNLPSSLDEIPNIELSRECATMLAGSDPERAKFEAEVDCVAAWETRFKELPARVPPKSFAFINHTVTIKNPFQVEGPPSIRYKKTANFQECITNLFETDYPLTESWLPFAQALDQNGAEPSMSLAGETPRKKRKSRKRKAESQVVTDGGDTFGDDDDAFSDRYLVQSKQKRKRIKSTPRPRRSLRTVQDRGKVNTASSTQLRRNRLTQVLRHLTDSEKYQIVVCIVVVRTLAGGIEKHIDWAIVKDLLPTQEEYIMRDAWKTMANRFRNDVSDLTESLQQAYVEALVEDEVPSVNYDNIRATDWQGIFQWALSNLDKFIIQKPEELPASRERLFQAKDYMLNEVKGVQDLFTYNVIQTAPRKEEAFSSVVFGKTLQVRDKTLKLFGSEARAEDEEADIELARAKSWVMAATLTTEISFDAAKAQTKLLRLGSTHQQVESLLERAINALQRDKLLARLHGNIAFGQGRGRGSDDLDPRHLRQYEASAKFFECFDYRRLITASMLKRAAVYKLEVLDVAFARDSVITIAKDTVLDDGDMIAVLNLFGMGMLSIRHGDDVPVSRWGLEWQKHGYSTRLVDKRVLAFSITLVPNKVTYISGDLLLVSTTQAGSGTEHAAEVTRVPRGDLDRSDNMGFIPIWFDINLDLQLGLWEMVLGAIIGLVSIRSGIDARELARTFRYGVSVREVDMVLTWAEKVGAVTRTCESGGWETKERWWFVLGPREWR